MNNLFYILFLTFISCSNSIDAPHMVQGNAFGTTYAIKYYSEKDLDIEKEIDSIVYEMNRSVSTYQTNSLISKINNGDSTIIVDKIFIDNYSIHRPIGTPFDKLPVIIRTDPCVSAISNFQMAAEITAYIEVPAIQISHLNRTVQIVDRR